ncbi:MAG: hypothetical protein RBT80_20095 [Candidatus Vecturithrix sp.]|jgi:hypothetical protein|nr:hypothetical protein [Candidatus Vecturithrix sp.]
MHHKRLHVLAGTIICLVILRGLMYGVIIPFDQAPDEKHHFLLIKAKHLQMSGASSEEKQHIASQIEFTWHRLLYPETQRTQEDFTGGFLPSPPSSMHLYYLVTGWMLNLCAFEQSHNEIYLLRGFSIVCGAIVIIFAIAIAHDLFPDDRFLHLGVPIFITFVPQFSAMNGVINNDKLAEVFAALLGWLIVKIFKQGFSWQYGLAYMAAAALALMSKRTTIFIVPLSLLVLFLYFWNGRLGLRMHGILLGGILGATLLIYLLLWNPTIYTLVDDYVISIPEARYLPAKVFRPELFSKATLLHVVKFFAVMYLGFWGIFGYMTIHLHHFWYLAAAFAQSLAILGLLKCMMPAKLDIPSSLKGKQEWDGDVWKAKVCYLFGASIALSLIIPVLRSIILRFDAPDLTQGRYLFTVMIPISVLTMLGLSVLFPRKYHAWIGGIGLFALLLFDTAALINYLLLNFHYAAFF